MIEMIDRVAKAMAAKNGAIWGGPRGEHDPDFRLTKLYYMNMARAAIEEMRVPTEAMVKALRFYGMLDGDPEEAWEKTILAALDPTTPLHGE